MYYHPPKSRKEVSAPAAGVSAGKAVAVSGHGPVIRVIFNTESKDEDEIADELADMYITQRTYYYTGRTGGTPSDDTVFIKYGDIDFTRLQPIDV